MRRAARRRLPDWTSPCALSRILPGSGASSPHCRRGCSPPTDLAFGGGSSRPGVCPSARRHGHPVVLGRALFEELRAADPAAGARPVIQAHLHAAVDVPVTDEGAFLDIDTRDAYQGLIGPGP